MTAYATLTDLYQYGLPQNSFGSISTSQQQAALDSRNAWADGYLRGRYQLPLLGWDIDLRMHVAQITAWDLLNLRGYAARAGADVEVETRAMKAIEWFEGVERGRVHPNVTPSAAPTPGTAYAQPQAITKQMRGW